MGRLVLTKNGTAYAVAAKNGMGCHYRSVPVGMQSDCTGSICTNQKYQGNLAAISPNCKQDSLLTANHARFTYVLFIANDRFAQFRKGSFLLPVTLLVTGSAWLDTQCEGPDGTSTFRFCELSACTEREAGKALRKRKADS
jgi:hypothetical protein